MKKLLIVSLAVFIALSLCFVACEEEPDDSTSSSTESSSTTDESSSSDTHEHNYGELIYDEEYHYYECECGEKKDKEKHRGTTVGEATQKKVCSKCGYVMEIKVGIKFNTLSVNDFSIYTKVPNSTELFDFTTEITTYGEAKFALALDENGVQTVLTKKLPLNVGDNKAYVFEMVDDEVVTIYEVNIRRRDMYEVTFDSAGGNAIEKQIIEEDSLATEPSAPTREGYTFTGWDYDFTNPIVKDTALKASWNANTDTKYTVNYYLQNLENDEYSLKETDTSLVGQTDTEAIATIKDFEHFTFNESKSKIKGNIDGNGSLVLDIYYTRDIYSLSTSNALGEISSAGSYKYGHPIESTATTYVGVEFLGWYDGEVLLSTEATYTFDMDKNVVARFEAKPEMKCFDFTTTETTCEITGIKDNTISTIVVPEYVTKIANDAFKNASQIKNLTIREGITNLPKGMLYGCSGIESITIPFVGESSLLTSESASTLFGVIFGDVKYEGSVNTTQYYSSSSYSSYYIPATLKSVTVTGGKIFYGAFYGCSSLTSVVIKEKVEYIGNIPFSGCSSLESLEIPFIGNDKTSKDPFGKMFGTSSYTGSEATIQHGYNPREGLLNPIKYTFYIPKSLKNVKVTGGLIVYNAFCECKSIESIILPNSLTEMGPWAFSGCTSLKFNEYENGCYLGSEENPYLAFIKTVSTDVEVVTIHENAKFICDEAFYECSLLKSITIPENIIEISHTAFCDCISLETIYYNAVDAEIAEYPMYVYTFRNVGTNTENGTRVIIGENVTTLPMLFECHYGADDNKKITSIEIKSNKLTEINRNAFADNKFIEIIVLPDSITSIGKNAFNGCTSLTIYCEAEAQPSGWDSKWNSSDCPTYWYSESEPTTEGNYWHYGTNGEIIIWE